MKLKDYEARNAKRRRDFEIYMREMKERMLDAHYFGQSSQPP